MIAYSGPAFYKSSGQNWYNIGGDVLCDNDDNSPGIVYITYLVFLIPFFSELDKH